MLKEEDKKILEKVGRAFLIKVLIVFVPLVILGGLGAALDSIQHSVLPLFLFLGLGLSFIVTTILVFKRFDHFLDADAPQSNEKKEVIGEKK